MYGLSKKSKIKDVIERVDDDTIVAYSVEERKIDTKNLKAELKELEELEEPDESELLDFARQAHPFFTLKEISEERIAELKEILK